MPTVEEIRWLAAWLEGEGSFYASNQTYNNELRIQLSATSTDYDVMQTVAKIFGKDIVMRKPTCTSPKIQYEVRTSGIYAIQWMMTLYPLMHFRRKQQIKKCISYWKQNKKSSHANAILKRYAPNR